MRTMNLIRTTLLSTLVLTLSALGQRTATHTAAAPVATDDPDVSAVTSANGYQYADGGSATDAWGAGGNEIGGIHRFQARNGTDAITYIQTQWIQNAVIGAPARIAIWQDNGSGDPRFATLLYEQAVTIQSNQNGVFNTYLLNQPVSVSGTFYVGFSTVAGPGLYAVGFRQVPAAQYTTSAAYLIQGAAGASFANLGNNFFVDEMSNTTYPNTPGYFLLRATGSNTSFTYQGKLKNNSASYTGNADMKFTIYQSETGGSPLATTLTVRDVNVTDGLFTVQIPFEFNTLFFNTTTDPFLDIAVRTNSFFPYTTLTPRQRITHTPLAINAMASEYALNVPWTGVYGLPAAIATPPWTPTANGMTTTSNYVGIGRTFPVTGASKFDIETNAASGNYGGMYITTQNGGWPFYGYSTPAGSAWTYYRSSDNTWRLFNGGEYFVLSNTGLLSVGTGAVSAAGYRLELPNTAGPAGQGRANAWVTYSSRELKENIMTLANPLDTLSKLRGVTFDWRAPNADGSHTHDLGFIAEEVAGVLPELVTRSKDGKATGLDYGRVVPVTVEAIKAQQIRIDSLQAENAELKARLERIEKALEADHKQ